MPSDDFSGEKIDNDAKIVSFCSDFEVSEVTAPNSVWFFEVELPIQEVAEFVVTSDF